MRPIGTCRGGCGDTDATPVEPPGRMSAATGVLDG